MSDAHLPNSPVRYVQLEAVQTAVEAVAAAVAVGVPITVPVRAFSPTPTLATSQILLAAPGTLFGMTAQILATLATGDYWLLLVDAVSAPAPGAVTVKWAWQFSHTLGTRDDIPFGDDEGGVAMTAGATLLLSTAGPGTYTAAGAYMIAQASVSA